MKVRVLTPEDLTWPLGRQDGSPIYHVGAGDYRHEIRVDPYPAYPADAALVEDLVGRCMETFPLHGPAELAILPHEFIDRVNGLTYEESVWKRPDGTEIEEHYLCHCGCGKLIRFGGQGHTIVLSGKRIPLHPAMVRYLVPHEYGHAVANTIQRRLGYSGSAREKFEAGYMAVRGAPGAGPKRYSGGKWHLDAGEVIANDFRVLFLGAEADFWPHDVPPPTHDDPIARWWGNALELCEDMRRTEAVAA